MQDREITVSEDITNIKPEKIIQSALQNNFPIALWRKPHSNYYHISISFSTQTTINETAIEELENGFIFSPFNVTEKNGIHFVKNDVIIKIIEDKIVEVNYESKTTNEQIASLTSDAGLANYYFSGKSSLMNNNSTKDEFINYVNQAIDRIRKGQFEKVVPSRKSTISLPPHFDPFKFFKTLHSSYPNAFVYLVSLPESGTWIGATPENLISIHKNKIFKTAALAGTQKYEDEMELADAAWRQKEIEEQAMVSRYIINCFKKIRLREFEEHGPKTVKAGNLIHLKTDFIVNMEAVNFPQLGSVMLKLLHPTSAICGMPKEPAMEFIKTHEGFERDYFSGYLGPVNTENSTDIFVNLRCMTLTDIHKAEVFAGAGVTIDSKAEKEWMETEMKMDTLLKLL